MHLHIVHTKVQARGAAIDGVLYCQCEGETCLCSFFNSLCIVCIVFNGSSHSHFDVNWLGASCFYRKAPLIFIVCKIIWGVCKCDWCNIRTRLRCRLEEILISDQSSRTDEVINDTECLNSIICKHTAWMHRDCHWLNISHSLVLHEMDLYIHLVLTNFWSICGLKLQLIVLV